ncbi:MAG: glycosyltransferase family 2 protein [Bacilli bacterium]|nr:glycosyltransferase family 2 protein [Bacilli bacterium]
MAKKIGMIIINYNDYEMTKRLLDNVSKYKCLEKIVVVDNNSSDDSYKKLKKIKRKNLVILKNENNNGYASGINIGVKYLIEEIGNLNIIISNADVIIDKEEDLKMLSSHIKKDIAVSAPVIFEHNSLNRGWKISKVSHEILFNLPKLHKHFKKKLSLYKESHYDEDTSIVDVVSGCFFMIDSNALQRVDYLDENTFLYYEELILAKKLKSIKKKELIDNRVVVIHDHSVTIDKSYDKINKYKLLKKSQKYYVDKYLKANSFEMLLLLITNKLTLFTKYISSLFRR